MKLVKNWFGKCRKIKNEFYLIMVYKFEAVPWGLKTVWYFYDLKDSVPQVLSIINKKKFDALIMPIFPSTIVR